MRGTHPNATTRRPIWLAGACAAATASAAFGGPRLAVIQPSGGRIGPSSTVITATVGGGYGVVGGGFGSGFGGFGGGFGAYGGSAFAPVIFNGGFLGRTGFGGIGNIRVYGGGPFFAGNRAVYVTPQNGAFYGSTTFIDASGREVLWSTQPPVAAESAEPAEPLSVIELAWTALAEGEASESVTAFENHLELEPDDHAAYRGLGIALLMDGRVDEAFAVIGTAYSNHPELASEPMTAADLGGRRGAREAFRVAVKEARRVGSSSGWLTAAVVAQGEGRGSVARRMLGEATEASLSAEVAAAMSAALDR